MAFPKDRRTILLLGGGLAVAAAVGLALALGGGSGDGPEPASPADRGGLVVDVAEAPALEPTRQLRCFVDGQFVGLATLADCARRNGVATGALDVGLDASGELAAAPTAAFAPPPELPAFDFAEPEPVEIEPFPSSGGPQARPTRPAPPPASGPACLRHVRGEWRAVASGLGLNACVRALYAGVCVRPGEAEYGRWGDTALRLVPRRVEQSADNIRFRTLAEQDRNCQFPGLN